MHLPLLLTLLATSALAAEVTIDVTNPVECTRKTQAGDSITVNYRGTLPNGEEFDSSYNRQPFQFQLGTGQVIKGYVHLPLLLLRL
jgi:FK506-binding protein 2